MNAMLTVAFSVWKEIARKRVMLLTLGFSVIFLGLFAFLVHLIGTNPPGAGGEQPFARFAAGIVALTLGFFCANFLVAYLIIFTAAGAVSSEAESGLLLALLVRPIPRWRWYLAKWLGYASWSVGFSLVLYGAIVGIVQAELQLAPDPASLLAGFCLFALVAVLLVSVAMLGSTLLPTLGNGVIVALLFGLSFLGGMIERVAGIAPLMLETTRQVMLNIGVVIGLFMPADALQRRMLALLTQTDGLPLPQSVMQELGPFANPVLPSPAFLWYSVLFTGAMLLWGMARFSRKDF